jgi:hypothetical protein
MVPETTVRLCRTMCQGCERRVRDLPANVHLVWPKFDLLTLLPANVHADRAITRLNRLFPGSYMHFCRQIAGLGRLDRICMHFCRSVGGWPPVR